MNIRINEPVGLLYYTYCTTIKYIKQLNVIFRYLHFWKKRVFGSNKETKRDLSIAEIKNVTINILAGTRTYSIEIKSRFPLSNVVVCINKPASNRPEHFPKHVFPFYKFIVKYHIIMLLLFTLFTNISPLWYMIPITTRKKSIEKKFSLMLSLSLIIENTG